MTIPARGKQKKRLEIPEEIFLSYIFPFPSGRESESLKTVLGVLKKAMRCAEIAALIAVFVSSFSRERGTEREIHCLDRARARVRRPVSYSLLMERA